MMSEHEISIALFGCVESSLTAIKSINRSRHGSLKCLVTTRKKTFNSDYVDLSLHVDNGVRIIFIEDVTEKEISSILEACKIKIGFCVGWSNLITETIYSKFDLFFAYHPSPLPIGRGRNPITWAIALGMEETASSFFLISNKPDAGDIVHQKPVVITISDTARTLYNRLLAVIDVQIEEILFSVLKDNLVYKKQSNELATYWRKRVDSDRLIDFRMSSKNIYNLVRSLGPPYVYAQAFVNGTKCNVDRAFLIHKVPDEFVDFGKVLAVSDNIITVKTSDGAVGIQLLEKNLQITKGDYL